MRKPILAFTFALLITSPAAAIDVGGAAGAASNAAGAAGNAAGGAPSAAGGAVGPAGNAAGGATSAAGDAVGATPGNTAGAAGSLAGGAAGAAGAAAGAAGSAAGNAGGAAAGAAGSIGAATGGAMGNGASDRGGGVGSSPAGGVGDVGGRSAGGSRATESTVGSRTTGSVGEALIDAPSRTPARSPALAPVVEEEVITAPAQAALRPSLPFVLLPQDTRGEPSTNMPVRIVPRLGTVQGSPTVLRALTKPLTSVNTAPPRAVRACRDTIKAAAAPYQAKQVEAVGAGPASPTSQGITTVPIDVRVIYARRWVSQVRQARISCRLNDRGIVVALR